MALQCLCCEQDVRVIKELKFRMALCPECLDRVAGAADAVQRTLVHLNLQLPTVLQRAVMRGNLRYDAEKLSELKPEEVLRMVADWLEEECPTSTTPIEANSTRTLKLPATTVDERSSTRSGTEET